MRLHLFCLMGCLFLSSGSLALQDNSGEKVSQPLAKQRLYYSANQKQWGLAASAVLTYANNHDLFSLTGVASNKAGVERANYILSRWWGVDSREELLETMLTLSEKGHRASCADSLCNLGLLYNDGRAFEKDLNKSIEFYQRASVAGANNAENNLAWLLFQNPELWDADEAIRLARIGVQKNECRPHYHTLAKVLIKAGRWPDAWNTLNRWEEYSRQELADYEGTKLSKNIKRHREVVKERWFPLTEPIPPAEKTSADPSALGEAEIRGNGKRRIAAERETPQISTASGQISATGKSGDFSRHWNPDAVIFPTLGTCDDVSVKQGDHHE